VLFIIFKNILPCCLPFLNIIIHVCLVDDQEVLKKAEDQFFKEMGDKLKSKNDGKKRTIKSKKLFGSVASEHEVAIAIGEKYYLSPIINTLLYVH